MLFIELWLYFTGVAMKKVHTIAELRYGDNKEVWAATFLTEGRGSVRL